MHMDFAKLHGTGNDFVVIDARRLDRNWAALAKRMCDRHFGAGGDGLILARTSEVAGVGNRDAQAAAVEAVGNCTGALQHADGNLRGSVGLDLDRRQVDELEPVCLGELGRAETPAVARDLAVASRESK